MLKIVFMGTPELAATVLDTMMEAGLSVSLAVSQPDRVRGRGRKSQPTPVHACADKWGIPVFQPVRVREAGAVVLTDDDTVEDFDKCGRKNRQQIGHKLNIKGVAYDPAVL